MSIIGLDPSDQSTVYVDFGTNELAAFSSYESGVTSSPLASLGESISIPAIESARIYLAIGSDFDSSQFPASGPTASASNPVMFDKIEFDTSTPGSFNINSTNVDFYAFSYTLTATPSGSGTPRTVGFSASRTEIIEALVGVPSSRKDQRFGNTKIFPLTAISSGGELLDFVRDRPWFESMLDGAASEPSSPAAKATPLCKTQISQLVAALETKHGVKVRVRSSLTQSGAASETLAWAIYSLGRKDVCLAMASKDECAKKLHVDPDIGDYDLTKCNHEYLVHARFGAELSLGDPESLKLPCKIAKIRQFEATDVDADGKPEIVVDVIGRQTSFGIHETEIVYGGREVRILRLDDSKQFELTVGWSVADIVPGYGSSKNYKLVDDNADGHPDLLIETMEFMGLTDVEFDEAMWVRTDIPKMMRSSGPIPRSCGITTLTRTSGGLRSTVREHGRLGPPRAHPPEAATLICSRRCRATSGGFARSVRAVGPTCNPTDLGAGTTPG